MSLRLSPQCSLGVDTAVAEVQPGCRYGRRRSAAWVSIRPSPQCSLGVDTAVGSLGVAAFDQRLALQALCNASGELDMAGFERVMRNQIQLFIQVKPANAADHVLFWRLPSVRFLYCGCFGASPRFVSYIVDHEQWLEEGDAVLGKSSRVLVVLVANIRPLRWYAPAKHTLDAKLANLCPKRSV